MLLLAKYLPKDKYQVTLACSSFQKLNPWCQQFMALGVLVQRLKVLHKHDPRHFFYLKRMLPQFDLLHLHAWNPASCRWALAAAGKTPVVMMEHDPFRLSGIKTWLRNKLTTKIKTVIVASEAAKTIVMEQSPHLASRIKVIPNGIDIEEWEKESVIENRAEFRRLNFGNKHNEKVILCVAELHERKGQKYLIHAMKEVLKEFPDAKLALVGDGKERRYYEKLARPIARNVLFMGRRKDVAQLMAAADVFVLPSVREAFGLVLLEAATSGVPIVATNVGGIPEIIENEESGLIVKPQRNKDAPFGRINGLASPRLGLHEDLAKAISILLRDPAKAAELARTAKSKIKAEFDIRIMAQKTAEVYDEIL